MAMKKTIKNKITKGFWLFLFTFFSVGVQAAEWDENDMLNFFNSHDTGTYVKDKSGGFKPLENYVDLDESSQTTTGPNDVFFHAGPGMKIWGAEHLKGPYFNGVNKHGVMREFIGYSFTCGNCGQHKNGATLAEGITIDELSIKPVYVYTFPDDGFTIHGVDSSDEETSNQATGGGVSPAPPPPPEQYVWYIDKDGDGYDAGTATFYIKPPGEGWKQGTSRGKDCDDKNIKVYKLNKCDKCEVEPVCGAGYKGSL